MQDTAYELLSMGMRYVFLLLAALMLLRSWRLMRRESREHRRALRLLPDAGLVGEVVDLRTGLGMPLPREGLMGSGHNCDVRFPHLRRREVEFQFIPGEGIRLIPMHRTRECLLDNAALTPRNNHALHGTVLEIAGNPFRFRLFAGLDLPVRKPADTSGKGGQALQLKTDPASRTDSGAQQLPVPPDGGASGTAWDAPPPASLSGPDLGMTWQYAPLPTQEGSDPGELPAPPSAARRRRAWRDRGRYD